LWNKIYYAPLPNYGLTLTDIFDYTSKSSILLYFLLGVIYKQQKVQSLTADIDQFTEKKPQKALIESMIVPLSNMHDVLLDQTLKLILISEVITQLNVTTESP